MLQFYQAGAAQPVQEAKAQFTVFRYHENSELSHFLATSLSDASRLLEGAVTTELDRAQAGPTSWLDRKLSYGETTLSQISTIKPRRSQVNIYFSGESPAVYLEGVFTPD